MPKNKSVGKSADLLKQAIESIDAEIKALTEQRDQLAKLVTGVAAAPAARRRGRPAAAAATAAPKKAKGGAKKKRSVSPATKKKLKEAAKARWARYREEKAASE
ncbi:MAG: hypothetical protein SF339_05060 [Blastocatellia bacterium]|nr:hypothetical protein [Blastocatellia bacterium]